jgi:GT2 family glycosyltransferase
MREPPLVYVIVLTWNGKNNTLECLRSLQRMTYPIASVLVVDNASIDGSADAIRTEFPNVQLIINNSNLRYARGNNVGMKHALERGTEYVLLLNNDTVVDCEFLSQLVHVAESDKKVGMVGPKIYYYGEQKRIWFAGGRIEWWKGWVSHNGIREHDIGQYDAMKEVDYLTGCCMLVKREVIERVGLLDESYYIYGEDADWCIRAARAGYSLLYVPSAIVWHKLSASTGGHFSWFKNWNKLKSQLRLMARYAKPYHWLTIPGWMVLNVLLSSFRVRRIP